MCGPGGGPSSAHLPGRISDEQVGWDHPDAAILHGVESPVCAVNHCEPRETTLLTAKSLTAEPFVVQMEGWMEGPDSSGKKSTRRAR